MNKGTLRSYKTTLSAFIVLLAACPDLSSQTHPSRTDSLVFVATNKGNSDKMREQAVRTIGDLKTIDAATINVLTGCLSDENPNLVGEAARSLSRVGKRAVPALAKALQDKNAKVRWGAAIAFSNMGKSASEALPSLVEALNDKNDNVRWCSLIALGNIGEVASGFTSQISKYLHDSNEDITWAAVYALSKINHATLNDPPDLGVVTSTIESRLPALMKEFRVPGVSVCLLKNGKVAWSKSFGIKDERNGEQVSGETMFEACSMSKPVFAYAVLKLADEKKLDLDKPLADYLDEDYVSIGGHKNTITARMILCHTSGLPNWRKGEEETGGPLPIYFKPGTKFSYSGEGYYYLQRVVEKITGMPLDLFAKKTLFDPLGLKHISYTWTKEHDANIASGHDTSGSFLQKTRYEHPNAAYTLYTSAEDYAAIIGTILNTSLKERSILSAVMRDEMIKHQVEVNVREPIRRPGRALGVSVYWGLGWAIDSTVTGNIIYHSGANRSGFRCYAQYNFTERTAIVILTNGLNGSDFWRRLVTKIGDF
jgi:CubicO group peptidase (beta-lactamase class C family)